MACIHVQPCDEIQLVLCILQRTPKDQLDLTACVHSMCGRACAFLMRQCDGQAFHPLLGSFPSSIFSLLFIFAQLHNTHTHTRASPLTFPLLPNPQTPRTVGDGGGRQPEGDHCDDRHSVVRSSCGGRCDGRGLAEGLQAAHRAAVHHVVICCVKDVRFCCVVCSLCCATNACPPTVLTEWCVALSFRTSQTQHFLLEHV